MSIKVSVLPVERTGYVKKLPNGKQEIIWINKEDNDDELEIMMTNEGIPCTNVQVQHNSNQMTQFTPAKDLITAVTANYFPQLEEVDIQRYCQDSIFFSDPVEKSLSRIIQVLTGLNNKASSSFASEDLFSIVDYIDMLTTRNHLYAKKLKDICDFLIPQEIPVTYPWEKLLDPVKRLAANPVYSVAMIPVVMRIYLLWVLQSKLCDLSGINLPSLLAEVERSYPSYIEQTVVNHIAPNNNDLRIN